MEFRPCIDIHNGKVKQIVGGSLTDEKDQAVENFVAKESAANFAKFYQQKGIVGGHIIMLNSVDSPYYEATKAQAMEALMAYPNSLQIGGGINAGNARSFIEAGASHVIVTSYVFKDGMINYDNLKALVDAVGKEHIVLDLSCKKKENGYVIVTDRWQKESQEILDISLLDKLADFCDEFLIHAVDVEGKSNGIELDLVKLLGGWNKKPVTYAGGVHSFEDLDLLKMHGKGNVHVTIGSALDLFGGQMGFEKVLEYIKMP
ncbi:MAG: phosphoribosylformimino-5-aminoimidazole carboxamide ribotide isomerase [Lachnospiraceae bacterium]|nr:phosphoribosylformimino-5-aminoimidazole carboxamide ribotide isomerase [Lachnospiraceae bacterium]